MAGQSPGFTSDMIEQINARQAKDYAQYTKAETIEFLKEGDDQKREGII